MSSSRDTFELERLANELEAHEHCLDTQVNDLPFYPPLAHTNPFFIASHFNIEEFLLSRMHMSLPELRTELRDYLAILKEELVQLINDKYEAFMSFSTDLRVEGSRLEQLKWPLEISSLKFSCVSPSSCHGPLSQQDLIGIASTPLSCAGCRSE